MTERHGDPLEGEDPREAATPGAQRQIDDIRKRMHFGLRAMVVAVGLIVVGFAFTGWQIKKAFDNQDSERSARVSASASINTFLCQRIDAVGNGVAALVRVSLSQSPEPADLPMVKRLAYERFARYAKEQERPPRCRQLALKIATLTDANPADVVITPIHLRSHSDRSGD